MPFQLGFTRSRAAVFTFVNAVYVLDRLENPEETSSYSIQFWTPGDVGSPPYIEADDEFEYQVNLEGQSSFHYDVDFTVPGASARGGAGVKFNKYIMQWVLTLREFEYGFFEDDLK